MFMHIGGMGPEQDLATSVGRCSQGSRKPAAAKAKSLTHKSIRLIRRSIRPSWIQPSASRVNTKMGCTSLWSAEPRGCTIVTIGNQMGVNTWGTFAGSDDQAVVDGDFAMREAELQNVLKTLRKARINVVAIHQHMVGEEPRIMFLHYWGIAPGGRFSPKDSAPRSTRRTISSSPPRLAFHRPSLRKFLPLLKLAISRRNL